MISLRISEPDWVSAKNHWKFVKQHLTNAAAIKKANFINDCIFEAATFDVEESSAATVPVPSVKKMSEIMNEIDHELTNDDDSKISNSAPALHGTTEDVLSVHQSIKKFIGAPVESIFIHRCS